MVSNTSIDELFSTVEIKHKCLQLDTIYVKEPTLNMSHRKKKSLMKIAMLQKYYQCNPIRFIEDFFNIVLLDAQAYIIQSSWNCQNVLVLATRG